MKGVEVTRVKYHLHAWCDGASVGHVCTFSRRALGGVTPAAVRADAQRHALDWPGHVVSADILDRTTYTRPFSDDTMTRIQAIKEEVT